MATMIQNNFVAGELSPALYGRSDLQSYYHGCAKAENFIVSREGSLKKRHGIAMIGTFGHPYSDCRVFPYIYDRDEAGVVIFFLHSTGKINAQIRRNSDLDPESTTSVTVYPDTSCTAAMVKSIRCSQIGDTIYANCKGHFNKKIVVDWANLSMTVSDYTQLGKPNSVTSVGATKSGFGSGTTRTITYGAYVCKDGILSDVKTCSVSIPKTWTAGAYIDISVTHGQSLDDKNFDYILIGKKSGSFFGELARFYPEDVTATTVAFTDENHTPADVIYAQTNVLGSDFTPPLVTGAFQQRLVFANAGNGSTALPMTLWFSAVGNLYNFYANRPTTDEDPFSPTLMSTGPAFIRWIVPYQKLMIVFTDAGIFAISGSQTEGFCASTCHIDKLSGIAVSQDVQPLESESGIVFVGSDDKTLYTLAYDLQSDATRPVNRMVLVKHITRSAKITSIALQQYPDQIVWCRLSDGTLAAFTFERDQEVYAWSRATSSNISFLDVVGTGSVTDSTSDHTYSDVVFIAEGDNANSFKLGRFTTNWRDANGTNANVVAEAVTLPAESTSETIAFRTKNVKDVLVRLFESGPVAVMPYQSGLAEQTLNAGATSFTGDAKVKPLGYVNDLGQMRFRSTGNTNAEILAVVTKMEVG